MTMNTENASQKQLQRVLATQSSHWVGNGFPVRTLFSYAESGKQLSPFLLFDYAGPMEFTATTERRGVGEHPHRGFETVTIVYQGEVEHRDSSGGGGVIGAGDVQWMTAASGLVHEEFHGKEFAAKGGLFEMVQLWVNLPAANKLDAPGYQSIRAADIPVIELADSAGDVRVIAGDYNGITGPASTFTPMHVWDLHIAADQQTTLDIPAGWSAMLMVRHGELQVNDSEHLEAAQGAMFEHAGSHIKLSSNSDVKALLLAGKPIEEPIAGRGPFVMNTQQEIHQAIADYQGGRMGRL